MCVRVCVSGVGRGGRRGCMHIHVLLLCMIHYVTNGSKCKLDQNVNVCVWRVCTDLSSLVLFLLQCCTCCCVVRANVRLLIE